MDHNEIIALNKRNVTIEKSDKGYGYTHFAARDLMPGEMIMQCCGEIITQQTSHLSMQIGQGYHFMPGKWSGAHLNHSCEPNAYVNSNSEGFPALYALRKIKKGEEINYHYAMTEYAWARHCKESHVQCLCGAKNCKGKILSFSQLSRKEQEALINNNRCSDYLQKRMDGIYINTLVSSYHKTMTKTTTINRAHHDGMLVMPQNNYRAA